MMPMLPDSSKDEKFCTCSVQEGECELGSLGHEG